MKTYRQTSRSAREVRFADPDAFYNTATVKVDTQPKKAGSSTVYNVKSSVNVQRTATLPAPEGCTDLCLPRDQEKLTGTISLSGSSRSKAEVKQVLQDLRALSLQFENDLTAGFLPTAENISVMVAVP